MFGNYLKAIAILEGTLEGLLANTKDSHDAAVKVVTVQKCIFALQNAWDNEEAEYAKDNAAKQPCPCAKCNSAVGAHYAELRKDEESKVCQDCYWQITKEQQHTEYGGGHDY